jgi:signal transduction histidine kinase
MNFAVKITLLLFAVMSLLIVLVFGYVYLQIDRTFTEQSDRLMDQSADLIQQRLDLLKENLRSEMEQLSSSVFLENETTLAAMMKDPPEFNTEVTGFATRLRHHTSFHFLSLLSPDRVILSASPKEASFGAQDSHPTFPVDQPAFLFDQSTRLALRRKATFGQHALILEGGYFLRDELEKIPLHEIELNIEEADGQSFPLEIAQGDAAIRSRTMILNDYQNQPLVRITVSTSMKELMEEEDRLIRNLAWFILGTLTVCVITGYLLSLSVSHPMRVLKNAALEMSAGNLQTRVEVEGSGEIASLMQAFNEMSEQLEEKQKKLIQTERIAAWQEIARHLAHEIKNPLTPIRTSITNLRLSLEKAPEKFSEIFLESSESIMEEVETLRQLADEFSRFARLPAPSLKPGRINDIIQKNLVLYQGLENIKIHFKPGDIPVFAFDPAQISEVVHNLLQNAADAIEGEGTITITTSLEDQQILLTVEDTGKGMEEEVRREIFTPYFTTKAKGTGLGLAIVQRIITEHGGAISVESAPLKGTRFEIRLPVR